MLLVGIIFCAGGMFICPYWFGELAEHVQILDNKTVETVVVLAIAYQIGLIINWIGSIFIEGILKNANPKKYHCWLSRIFQIEWRDYKLYQQVEKQDPKMITISRELTSARNSLTVFLLLTVIAFWNYAFNLVMGLFACAVLFYFAYRKHAAKIVSRIDYNIKKPA